MASGEETVQGTSLLARACQNCAKRKVRCDKAIPQCSNCRTAGLKCNVDTPKPAEHRQRVLISNRYERKIDAIEGRLGKIEQLLEALLPRLASGSDGPPPLTSNSKQAASAPTGVPNDPLTGPPDNTLMDGSTSIRFEGESSVTAHSYDARKTLDNLIEASPNIRKDPDIIAALGKLQVAMQEYAHQLSSGHSRSSLDKADNFAVCNRITSPDLPTLSQVSKVLHEVKGKEFSSLTPMSALIGPDEMVSFCERTYADLGSATLAAQTITVGVVLYCYVDLSNMSTYKGDVDLERCKSALAQALDTCISRFRLMVEPSNDSMLALLFCAVHGFQTGDFALGWASVCAGSRTMRNLGWHRGLQFAQLSNDEAARRRNIFWGIFIMDKILSLRLGCASNLQDWDITLDLPAISESPLYSSWSKIFHLSIELAKLHGVIYEKLYSPAAARITRQQKQEHVQWIVHRLNSVANNVIGISNPPTAFQPDRFEANRLEFQVMIGCLLTLAQRAAPPINPFGADPSNPNATNSFFSQECLEAARGTMRLHQQTAASMRSLSEVDLTDYLGWTILNSPFTPFHIIFCNVVISLDLNDLALLEDFVASLYSFPGQQPTGAVETFRELCSAFSDLAKHYIAACLKDPSSSSSSSSNSANSGSSAGVTPMAPDAWASNMLASIQPSFGGGGGMSNEDSVFMQLCEEWLANGQGGVGVGNGGGAGLGGGEFWAPLI
ncbi:hypothetical protein K431DRAFT_288416 [Polychaeton citri CBS 116435]|uniref:Zn(2)-C6 fungal-type domain-containing protein n=1 Tax=Polychaeton citri CBS 116435 TaxID=1314669 RepID=A0A9P4ULA8_9PEZI|nr:hypothetical protein K431DRAFT_288416 [Polychaeton citri CBS 116435]